MGADFSTSFRRANESIREMSDRVSSARDEVTRLSRTEVGDIFSRARRGADDLRSSAGRADSELRNLSDADVTIRAHDRISPVVDGITDRIGALAAAAGALVIGGSIKDTMFDGTQEYFTEAARSAAFLTPAQRSSALKQNDQLYVQQIIHSRSEGAGRIADAAPLVQDKSQMGDFVSASAKIQYIRPDSGAEEINRALSQSADSFKESYSQVADSMMYAYKEVGDRQQDLFDTFWEYSGYFKNMDVDSSQMSNFLTETVRGGAFNFDKPGDFFKETFGVKALNTGDMQKYFELRGAGKSEAARQAEAFTNDINSGDKQRMHGAVTALVADLASQTQNELKQSLTTMGSATAEDNGKAILSTYGTAFEAAPNMKGTTNSLVQRQQAADPMLELKQARAEISLTLQDMGLNISQGMLPVFQEFNKALTDNKGEIEAFIGAVTAGISKIGTFYTNHFKTITTALLALGAVVGTVKVAKFAGGMIGDVKGGYGKVKGWFGGRTNQGPGNYSPIDEAAGGRRFNVRRWNRNGSGDAVGAHRVTTMIVHAGTVIVNGSNRRGKKSKKKNGSKSNNHNNNHNNNNNNRNGRNPDGSINARRGNQNNGNPPDTDSPSRRNGRVTYRNGRIFPNTPTPPPEPPVPPRNGLLRKLGKGAKYLKPAAKAAGIVGTVATVGMGAYDLYQASKEGGLKEGLSTKGGSMVGSIAGGVVGGAVGSLIGPVGTALGAAAGSWIGEKLGTMADESGLTRKAVDAVSSVVDKTTSWFKSTGSAIGDFFTGKDNKPAEYVSTGVASVTFGTMTPERQKQVKEAMTGFAKDVGEKGLVNAVKDSLDGPVGQKVVSLKNKVVGIFKGSGADKAKKDIADVGVSSDKTKKQAQDMGITATKSTKDIANGASKASTSLKNIGGSARQAAAETRSHLEQLSNISSKATSWGSNLIDMMVGGIRSKFPALSNVVSNAAGIIGNFLGFHSPTKEGPASDSDKWAPNFVNMFADGLKPDRIRQKVNSLAGELQPPSSTGTITMAKSLGSAPATRSAAGVTIENITIDMGPLAQGITDFAQFSQMLKSPEGRALIRNVVGQELLHALESGG
ncbi:tail tape measure protein [Paenibacillus kandeliae]|uniref:tail tape measure protein n=1 Tax=Paenibacillus kandeliae TaxID=3231269 RepID=UPI0034585512